MVSLPLFICLCLNVCDDRMTCVLYGGQVIMQMFLAWSRSRRGWDESGVY